MNTRMNRVNELLRAELAQLINQNISLQNGLITITQVKCSPDLKNATVMVSVLPDNITGTALKKLRQNSTILRNQLKTKVKLKYIPRLNWRLDPTERQADELEQVIKDLT